MPALTAFLDTHSLSYALQKASLDGKAAQP